MMSLMDAVNADDMKAVRHLIEVQNISVDQGSALSVATSKKQTDLTTYLLNNGANANKLDAFGTSALHYAARTNNIVNMKELLKAGAKPNARDKAGVTPLHLCALYGWPDCVTLLLKANASPHQPTVLGVYAIDLCLSALLRRTQGLFDKNTDLNDIKKFIFEERTMLRSGIRDNAILKMSHRSDIKRLQRVLYLLIDAKKDYQVMSDTLGISQ